MKIAVRVRVTECSSRHRIEAATVDLSELVRYVREHAGEDTADRLRHDLETTGRARIDGEFVWFEYEKTD